MLVTPNPTLPDQARKHGTGSDSGAEEAGSENIAVDFRPSGPCDAQTSDSSPHCAPAAPASISGQKASIFGFGDDDDDGFSVATGFCADGQRQPNSNEGGCGGGAFDFSDLDAALEASAAEAAAATEERLQKLREEADASSGTVPAPSDGGLSLRPEPEVPTCVAIPCGATPARPLPEFFLYAEEEPCSESLFLF